MLLTSYIEAVYSLIGHGHELTQVIENLKSVLLRKKHMPLLRDILRGLAQKCEKAEQKSSVFVFTTSKGITPIQEKAIDSILTEMNSENFKYILDETIVGGFVLESNGRRLDRSYKTALFNMYKNLIA